MLHKGERGLNIVLFRGRLPVLGGKWPREITSIKVIAVIGCPKKGVGVGREKGSWSLLLGRGYPYIFL